jgi:hypothetical protein
MRNAHSMLGMLALASAGLFACNSATMTNGSLGFTVAESLLVLETENAGFVLLSSATGNCDALKSGVPLGQVANTDYLVILLGVLDTSGNFVALTAGSYTVIDPSASFNPPGLLANAADVTTDSSCNPGESDATSGTATLSPFDASDGGSSSLSYSVVFGSTQVSGTYALTTCLISGMVDAGAGCIPCDFAADGEACAIQ